MSQLSCVNSGYKIQRQKEGPQSLGERSKEIAFGGREWGKEGACSIERAAPGQILTSVSSFVK